MDVRISKCLIECKYSRTVRDRNGANAKLLRICALTKCALLLKTAAFATNRMYKVCPSPLLTVLVCMLCWTHVSTAFTLNRDFYYGVFTKRGKITVI